MTEWNRWLWTYKKIYSRWPKLRFFRRNLVSVVATLTETTYKNLFYKSQKQHRWLQSFFILLSREGFPFLSFNRYSNPILLSPRRTYCDTSNKFFKNGYSYILTDPSPKTIQWSKRGIEDLYSGKLPARLKVKALHKNISRIKSLI